MAKVFNIFNSGSFTDSVTFTTAMSTTNAIAEGNITTTPIQSVASLMKYAQPITVENSPIRGMFLNIASVSSVPTGTMTVVLSSSVSQVYTFTYATSSLLQGKYTGIGFTTSQYWQGFDFGNIVLPTSTFFLTITCSRNAEVSLVGGTLNNFNRYIIPTNRARPFYLFDTPTMCVGSYLQPILSGGDMPLVSVSCINISSNSVNGFNVWNRATVSVATSALNITSTTVAAPGGTLIISPPCNVTLNGNIFAGLNSSTVTISGTDTLPYTFLTKQAEPPDTKFYISDNVVGKWKKDDKIAFTSSQVYGAGQYPYYPHYIVPAVELLFLSAANLTFDTQAAGVAVSRLSLSSVPFPYPFRGAPLCNMTRDIVFTAAAVQTIWFEDSCKATIHNIVVNGNSSAVMAYNSTTMIGLTLPGCVNILSDNASVQSCVFRADAAPGGPRGGTWYGYAGIYVNASRASNVILRNNLVCVDAAGIIVARDVISKPTNNIVVDGNVVFSSWIGSGIATNVTDGSATFTNNILNSNGGAGISINPSTEATTLTALSMAANSIIGNFSNNTCFNNNHGIRFNNCAGTYIGQGEDYVYNRIANIYASSNPTAALLTLSGCKSGYSTTDGVLIVAASGIDVNVNITNLTAISAAAFSSAAVTGSGLVLNGARATVSNSVFANNKTAGISLRGNNFSPINIQGCTIGLSSDTTSILLDQARCEKVSVYNTTFSSISSNITLAPAASALIEGSYVFTNCNFGKIMLDPKFSSRYQTDVLNETGVVLMYHNNTMTNHQRYLVAGKIESDVNVYYNPVYPISEKLTPNSKTVKLRSSKKIIPLDNYVPMYLVIGVMVKKTNWGNNSNPRLIVVASEAFYVYEDFIVKEHDTDTTEWISLSSATPVLLAQDARGAVEVYVDCMGTSGGSINVDSWNVRVFPADEIPLDIIMPTPTITPTVTLTPTITPTLTPSPGVLIYTASSIAGSAGVSGSADGVGAAALFQYPSALVVDSSNTLYVSDTNNHIIRKITSNGTVTTIAGTAGTSGTTDGIGAAARFNRPGGLVLDSTNNILYVIDVVNLTIRKIILSTNTVSTFAGAAGTSGTTDGIGAAARFNSPLSITRDNSDNIFVSDNAMIRKITPTGAVTTLAGAAGVLGIVNGTGPAARFKIITALAVDLVTNNMYAVDDSGLIVRKITSAGVVSYITGGVQGNVDGLPNVALFNLAWSMAYYNNTLILAQYNSSTIRKIVLDTNTTSTIAGMYMQTGNVNGIGTAARFNNPWGVAINNNGTAIYICDRDNHIIRKIIP